MTDVTILQAALQYRNYGWNVIQLKPKSKEAAVEWKRYQKEKATENELYNWFGNNGNNIGIVTGRISRIFAIDIDGYEAYTYFMGTVGKLCDRLPNLGVESLVFKTGGRMGYHVIVGFNPEEFPEGFRTEKLWAGKEEHSEIAIKGYGAYIVAPPSIHPDTGNKYQIDTDNDVKVLTKSKFRFCSMLYLKRKNRVVSLKTQR